MHTTYQVRVKGNYPIKEQTWDFDNKDLAVLKFNEQRKKLGFKQKDVDQISYPIFTLKCGSIIKYKKFLILEQTI